MDWDDVRVDESGAGSVFGCRIKTGARRTGILGPYGERVKIAVDAPPRDGRANARLLEYLASVLRCSRRHLSILSGESSPDKRLEVRGRTPGEVRALLLRAALEG